MSNTALKDEILLVNMASWKRANFSYYKEKFAKMLGCGDKRIRWVQTKPGDGRYDMNGFVVIGPYNVELGRIFWDDRGFNTGFKVNEVGCRKIKTNIDKINKKIDTEMKQWYDENYDYMISHLAKLCCCSKKEIKMERIVPGLNFNDNCCFIFRGPQVDGKDNYLGDIQWDMNGDCLDFELDNENVMMIRRFYKTREKALMERASRKSVNRTEEQKKEREISLGKELGGFIISHFKGIAVGVALFVAVSSFANWVGQEFNTDYINSSYKAGYAAVNYETHRTDNNQYYWYDYGDIAGRYNDSYDFDSWVYGTYNNVGWNTESKLSCMDELFDKLEDRGITEYDSFLEYCNSKGVCTEKDGKLVVDTREFRNYVEDYMRDLNSGSIEKEEDMNANFRL